jgi:hypothetical protein
MKLFVYHVGNRDYPDTEAFGEGWKKAKAEAAELGKPVYRTILETSREVYCNAGCFVAEHLARPEEIKIFKTES